MARTVRHKNLESRDARRELIARGKPFWQRLETGLHLGYRRVEGRGGSWIGRRFLGAQRYAEKGLGVADDLQDADGKVVLSFDQAQAAARAWWKGERRRELGIPVDAGPYTVSDALRDYFEEREREGSKGVNADRKTAEARITPDLGSIEVEKLTTLRVRKWHGDLSKAPRIVRTGVTAAIRAIRAIDAKDGEAGRARKATANRILTILKAALNHAFRESRVASDDAWRKLKPFKSVETPVVRFLRADECQRLINACDKDFRSLVRGAVLTGCRYGELTRMTAGDFNAEAGNVTVRISKAGTARRVVLNDEGRELFAALTIGRSPRDLIFRRGNGSPWRKSEQARPLEAASARARVEPAATFHILRHSYASALAMKGVPMGVIAVQLGHADTRMTERHYAHLAPSYVADTIRAAMDELGVLAPSNVVGLEARR